jgi:hypothetical protein
MDLLEQWRADPLTCEILNHLKEWQGELEAAATQSFLESPLDVPFKTSQQAILAAAIMRVIDELENGDIDVGE